MLATTITCGHTDCGEQHSLPVVGEPHTVRLYFEDHGWYFTGDSGDDFAELDLCPRHTAAYRGRIARDHEREQLDLLIDAAGIAHRHPEWTALSAVSFLAAASEHDENPGSCEGDCAAERAARRLIGEHPVLAGA